MFILFTTTVISTNITRTCFHELIFNQLRLLLANCVWILCRCSNIGIWFLGSFFIFPGYLFFIQSFAVTSVSSVIFESFLSFTASHSAFWLRSKKTHLRLLYSRHFSLFWPPSIWVIIEISKLIYNILNDYLFEFSNNECLVGS